MDRTNTRKLTVFGTLIIVLSFCYDVSSQDYRILVTNDDGIDSPLLHNLVANLASLSEVEVVVAAPDQNQSGSSQSSRRSVSRRKSQFKWRGRSVFNIWKAGRRCALAVVQLQHQNKFDLVIRELIAAQTWEMFLIYLEPLALQWKACITVYPQSLFHRR